MQSVSKSAAISSFLLRVRQLRGQSLTVATLLKLFVGVLVLFDLAEQFAGDIHKGLANVISSLC